MAVSEMCQYIVTRQRFIRIACLWTYLLWNKKFWGLNINVMWSTSKMSASKLPEIVTEFTKKRDIHNNLWSEFENEWNKFYF